MQSECLTISKLAGRQGGGVRFLLSWEGGSERILSLSGREEKQVPTLLLSATFWVGWRLTHN